MAKDPDKKIRIYATSYNEEITGTNTLFIVRWPEGREVRFLVDFGITQEVMWKQHNGNVMYDITKVDFSILTHVHADHFCLFPLLSKSENMNPSYCSESTKAYLPVMLEEVSDRIVDEFKRDKKEEKKKKEALKLLKQRARTGRHSPSRPGKKDKKKCAKGKKRKASPMGMLPLTGILYTKDDARRFMKTVKVIPYKKKFVAAKGVHVTFYENGHVEGSVLTMVRVFDKNESLYFLITGDIGVQNYITKMKTNLPKNMADKVSCIVSEATYGDQAEKVDKEAEGKKFLDVLIRAVNKKKRILLPSYALGRISQELLCIAELKEENPILKRLPVSVDTNLGVNFLKIDIRRNKVIRDIKDYNIVTAKNGREELKTSEPPYLVLLTSGQFNKGSILSYAELLEDPATIVVFGGYIPDHVQNYMALEKGTEITFSGQKIKLRADFVSVKCFSAHMQRHELLEFLSGFKNVNAILFTHGRKSAKQTMVRDVKNMGIVAHNMLYAKTVVFDRGGISNLY